MGSHRQQLSWGLWVGCLVDLRGHGNHQYLVWSPPHHHDRCPCDRVHRAFLDSIPVYRKSIALSLADTAVYPKSDIDGCRVRSYFVSVDAPYSVMWPHQFRAVRHDETRFE